MAGITFVGLLLIFTTIVQLVDSAVYSYGYDSATDYILLSPVKKTKQEQAQCITKNKCRFVVLTCPVGCPARISRVSNKRSCFINCSPKCEATCKSRKPYCHGYGSMCYDPRFVGGDGVMFYFHGAAGKDFSIVSDEHLQINAHFIGKRIQGRSRDYTWVQALGFMFRDHKLSIGVKKVGVWNDDVDQLVFSYDDVAFVVENSTWVSESGDVRIERTAAANGIDVVIDKLMKASINGVAIGEKENKIHNYQLTSDDCFAHLDIQFSFFNLSANVDGVLGQTYRPDFHNPVKSGVLMPIMGGEDRFQLSSLLSSDCKACKFNAAAATAVAASSSSESSSSSLIEMITNTRCASSSNGGIMCRR